jgi:putative transposase
VNVDLPEPLAPATTVRIGWDEQNSLMVDRDINAAINLKRLGLDIFPNIKRRSGNLSVVGTMDDSTTKEILYTLNRAARSPHHSVLA